MIETILTAIIAASLVSSLITALIMCLFGARNEMHREEEKKKLLNDIEVKGYPATISRAFLYDDIINTRRIVRMADKVLDEEERSL